MYSADFDYFRPKNLKEAVALLRRKKDAKILAGGHSLIPAMKLRVSAPSALIDIGRIRGLSEIKATKTAINIGALTTHAAIAGSRDVKKHCQILSEAAAQIGDHQVRNRGTIGGSLAHADPASDLPTVVVALGAKLTATGPGGRRQIPAEKFFTDLFTTALKASEVLTAISVPILKPGTGGAYVKHRHPASSYAVVGAAAVVTLKNGMISKARVTIGGVDLNPIDAAEAAAALIGEKPTAKNVSAACEHVPESITSPLEDIYASGDYRTHLAKVLAGRALDSAIKRAKRK